jgi:hypothetical protein
MARTGLRVGGRPRNLNNVHRHKDFATGLLSPLHDPLCVRLPISALASVGSSSASLRPASSRARLKFANFVEKVRVEKVI